MSKSTYALSVNDIFKKLESVKTDLTYGEAIFRIYNPTLADVSTNGLSANTFVSLGKSTDKLSFFVSQNMSYSYNITDYAWLCTKVYVKNDTFDGMQDSCKEEKIGWHWNNFTIEEWLPIKGFIFKAKKEYRVKVIATWEASLGPTARKLSLDMSIGGFNYTKDKWTTDALVPNPIEHLTTSGALNDNTHEINTSSAITDACYGNINVSDSAFCLEDEGTTTNETYNWTSSDQEASTQRFNTSTSSSTVKVLHNYNYTTTTANKARWASPAGWSWVNGFSAGTEATATQYKNMNVSDTTYALVTADSANDEPFWRFNYTVTETVSDINWIFVNFTGYENASEAGTCQYANFTSGAWVSIANLPTSVNTISVNITSKINHYISAQNQFVFTCLGANFDVLDKDTIFVDKAQIVVNYNTTSTSPATEINSSWTSPYSGIDGNDYQNIDKIGAVITINTYNPSASNSTYDNNIRPDIEVGIWNGTAYVNNSYCFVNSTMGMNLFNSTSWNCTINKTDTQFLNSWKFQANRSVIIRGVWLDAYNSTIMDEVNVTGVYGYVDGYNTTPLDSYFLTNFTLPSYETFHWMYLTTELKNTIGVGDLHLALYNYTAGNFTDVNTTANPGAGVETILTYNFTNTSAVDFVLNNQIRVMPHTGSSSDGIEVDFMEALFDHGSPVWWNTSFPYCRNATITARETLTNFSFYINITNTTNFQKYLNDTRWVNASCNDGGTVLDHWLEQGENTTWGTYYVEANATSAQPLEISVYYGNLTASSTSSCSNTFFWCNDFDGALGTWTFQNTGTMTNQSLYKLNSTSSRGFNVTKLASWEYAYTTIPTIGSTTIMKYIEYVYGRNDANSMYDGVKTAGAGANIWLCKVTADSGAMQCLQPGWTSVPNLTFNDGGWNKFEVVGNSSSTWNMSITNSTGLYSYPGIGSGGTGVAAVMGVGKNAGPPTSVYGDALIIANYNATYYNYTISTEQSSGGEVPPADTCSYDAGDWLVDCSDNCVISSPVNLGGNNILISGTGTFTTTSDIYNWIRLSIIGTSATDRCRVTCNGGCFKR